MTITFLKFYTFLLLNAFSISCAAAYQHNLAICAIFQNEAPYLKEWIEYHKIIGVQHFYLYNHASQDDYLKVLKPYIDAHVITLINWETPNFQAFGQKQAYMHAIECVRKKVKWLALIDIDEYLVPHKYNTLTEFLLEYDQQWIGGIGINWQMFGTSFVPRIKKRQLLTEMLTLKAEEQHSENIHIKSIVRPGRVIPPPHVHHFEYKDGCYQVNPNFEPFTGPFSPYVAIDKIQINHYWTKDEAFLFKIKIPRRMLWGESIENIQKRLALLNQVEDRCIAKFLPKLQEQMKKCTLNATK